MDTERQEFVCHARTTGVKKWGVGKRQNIYV